MELDDIKVNASTNRIDENSDFGKQLADFNKYVMALDDDKPEKYFFQTISSFAEAGIVMAKLHPEKMPDFQKAFEKYAGI